MDDIDEFQLPITLAHVLAKAIVAPCDKIAERSCVGDILHAGVYAAAKMRLAPIGRDESRHLIAASLRHILDDLAVSAIAENDQSLHMRLRIFSHYTTHLRVRQDGTRQKRVTFSANGDGYGRTSETL